MLFQLVASWCLPDRALRLWCLRAPYPIIRLLGGSAPKPPPEAIPPHPNVEPFANSRTDDKTAGTGSSAISSAKRQKPYRQSQVAYPIRGPCIANISAAIASPTAFASPRRAAIAAQAAEV